jgi:hypothetical protein
MVVTGREQTSAPMSGEVTAAMRIREANQELGRAPDSFTAPWRSRILTPQKVFQLGKNLSGQGRPAPLFDMGCGLWSESSEAADLVVWTLMLLLLSMVREPPAPRRLPGWPLRPQGSAIAARRPAAALDPEPLPPRSACRGRGARAGPCGACR